MITAARTMIASQIDRFEGIWFPGIGLKPSRSQEKGNAVTRWAQALAGGVYLHHAGRSGRYLESAIPHNRRSKRYEYTCADVMVRYWMSTRSTVLVGQSAFAVPGTR